jgi:hypothetical protein
LIPQVRKEFAERKLYISQLQPMSKLEQRPACCTDADSKPDKVDCSRDEKGTG